MANKYWVGGGANTNWVTSGNWSLTSGGAGGAAIPGSSDVAIFDGVGVNANGTSTIGATISIATLNITAGFTGTIAHNAVLTVVGAITLGANYTITGTSAISKTSTGGMTSNGKVWPNNLSLGGNTVTHTLLDDWTVGSLTMGNVNTFNSGAFSIYVNGNYAQNNNTSGSANIVLQGTGIWSIAVSGYQTTSNFTVTGTYSMVAGNTFFLNGGSLTILTGTLTVPSSTTVQFQNNDINAPTTSFQTISCVGTLLLLATLNANSISSGGTGTTYTGSFGFITNTFNQISSSNVPLIFQEGIEYFINTSFTCNQSRVGSIVTFSSSHATNRAKITLKWGATCNVLSTFTRIDASGGRPIRIINGTITNCINIQRITDLRTVAATF